MIFSYIFLFLNFSVSFAKHLLDISPLIKISLIYEFTSSERVRDSSFENVKKKNLLIKLVFKKIERNRLTKEKNYFKEVK